MGRMAFRGACHQRRVIGNVATAHEEDAVETADDISTSIKIASKPETGYGKGSATGISPASATDAA